MKKIIQYMKDHKKTFLFLLLIYLCFGLVYYFYSIPREAFFYALFLSLLFVVFFSFREYLADQKKMKELETIHKKEDLLQLEDLEAKEMVEEEYQRILGELYQEITALEIGHQNSLQSLEEFFMMWTHQMKLPIASIKLYLEQESNLDKHILQSQIKRIERYAQMVLVYLRLSSDHSDYLFEQVDLDQMVKTCIKSFSLDFIQKKITLRYSALNKKVVTDKKWFSFALEQILSNALKYTKKGEIAIYLEGEDLVIEDTGIGIKKQDLARLFDQNYTGYNGRINSESSGLGLYLVKKILDNLHHRISIESKVHVGTKVKVSITRRDFLAE